MGILRDSAERLAWDPASAGDILFSGVVYPAFLTKSEDTAALSVTG